MLRTIARTVAAARPCTRAVAIAAALAAGLALGCSSEDKLVPDTAEEYGWLQEASATWADAGIAPLPLSAHGSPNVHVVDDIEAACGAVAGATTLGCTHFDPLTIYLSSSIPEPLLARTVLHEMGHAIRGDGEHLTVADGCPEHGRGPFLMCPATGVDSPTNPDVAFIGAGPE